MNVNVSDILKKFGIAEPATIPARPVAEPLEPVTIESTAVEIVGRIETPASASPIRSVGRPVIEVTFDYIRDLTEPDLAALSESRPISTIQKLKDTHHRLASLLASGLRPMEVSQMTGYSPSRISVFLADPAFQELMEHYRAEYHEGARTRGIDLVERMTGLLADSLAELHDRILDRPEEMTDNALTEVIKVVADRAGFGPTSKSVNVNVDYAERLSAARRRGGLDTKE